MFNLSNPFAQTKVKEISEEELNLMRAERISQSLPTTQVPQAKPMKAPYMPLENDTIPSGTGLIKGIEFGMDTVPVKVPGEETATFIPVPTIYPGINEYIGNKMNFDEIHNYNNSQDGYFDNSARVLFAERIKFFIDAIVEAYQIDLRSVSTAMKKEAKEINELAGKNCRECSEMSCGDCSANTYVDLHLFMSSNNVIDLMPQLIEPEFYNTIKNTGGMIANKEIIQVTAMAFAGILLNKVNLTSLDEISHVKAMNDINTCIQVAATELINMIKIVVEAENIANLFDSYPSSWVRRIRTSEITEKL